MYDKSNAISAEGCAAVLAIGTATPPNCYYQSDFPNFYLGATKSDHLTDQLKDKFKRICEKSMVQKRYMYLTESVLEESPSLGACMAPSLDIRHDIAAVGVQRSPWNEWDRDARSRLPTRKTTWSLCNDKTIHVYHQGCHAGGTVLGLAKDLAENNEGARVLVVCCEPSSILSFHGW